MIFEKFGHVHVLRTVQKLPVTKEMAWDFLTDPKNLAKITPTSMGFQVISGGDEPMHAGQIIQYIVRPMLGIRSRWVTEITHVERGSYFVDEQRFGPYTLWNHKHVLQTIEGGVLMSDTVHYRLPFPLITDLFHGVMVKPRLREIFSFRELKLIEMFGAFNR